MDGINVNEENINRDRYTDDTAIIVNSESNRFGLSLNVKKTCCMVISKKKEPPKCHLVVDEQIIKQVKQFSCLGSILTSNGSCDTEIKQEKEYHKPLLWSLLLYGREAWNISKNMEEKLASVELWFYRRMLKVP